MITLVNYKINLNWFQADTASVLHEAALYIKALHEQVKVYIYILILKNICIFK